ncbi:MAG: ISL3 family transposase [Planctomycetota bacterium]|jgi:transposase
MSTSFLYHSSGLVGYHYLRTTYKNGNIYVYVRKHPGKLRCPGCDSHRLILKGTVTRRFKSLPIGRKQIILVVVIQRVECKMCRSLKQINLGFADPKKRYTRAFARYVLELSNHMTIYDVATHLNIGWDTVKEIQRQHLLKHFSKPKLRDLSQIAIDEISIGKRHRYLTIVLDLESGAVVFIGDGKGSDSLEPFWKKLNRAKANIEAVAMDMSPAYIFAVRRHLPKAVIVFDHFHIIKLFNDRLSELRRHLYNETTNYMKYQALKGMRWILLKNPENLDDEKNERERLEEALSINKPLATAYYLKEDLRQIWNQPTKQQAEVVLNDWVRRAAASGVTILKRIANTIGAYRSGILAYYDYPISTAPLEGTNTKIKTMQRVSYGFRDKEFFKLKIYAIHQSRYALVG